MIAPVQFTHGVPAAGLDITLHLRKDIYWGPEAEALASDRHDDKEDASSLQGPLAANHMALV